MIRDERATLYNGNTAIAIIDGAGGGVRLIPHDSRRGMVWLNQYEAVEFAQAILRAYDVTAKQAV